MPGLPEKLTLTINSINKTFQTFNFSLSGGDYTYEFVRTQGSNIKKVKTGQENYELEIGIVIIDESWLDSILRGAVAITITAVFSGIGKTITIYEATPIGMTTEVDSEGMLEGTIQFIIPALKTDKTVSITLT